MQLTVKLENCYGIQKLQKDFDFADNNSFVIYAPNGTMKTSFAKTFNDLSMGKSSIERVFGDATSRIVQWDGQDLSPEDVFVVESYNQEFKSTKISTLLVNKQLKVQYDAIYKTIDEKKEQLLARLQKLSGLKDSLEAELSDSITHESDQIFTAFARLEQEIIDGKKSLFGEILYKNIFNEKVLKLLASEDFTNNLREYIETYDKLIGASTFFKKGIFNHNNATDIAKSLRDNGFFKANHSVYINQRKVRKEVKTEKDLEDIIVQEKNDILEDPKLIKSFESLDKLITKNKDLRDFREYVEANKFILPELANLDSFKQKLWIAYLKENKDLYLDLMATYREGKKSIEDIIRRANEEKTQWSNVINIFNTRFSVPFVVKMENQDDVILNSAAPNIGFEFKDIADERRNAIAESSLHQILSSGENKALYILNIIFEVEARKAAKQKTLFIFDDLADSFDYKNKYAIIQYLGDIAHESNFYQLILTHNFDFYRTVCSRLYIGRSQRLHTVRADDAIYIVEEKYQNNPLMYIKKQFGNNDELLIAAIPFIRNLAEYCGLDECFQKLTSLLHQKSDTDSITVGDLEIIIKKVFHDCAYLVLKNHDKKVKELMYELADAIYRDTVVNMDLEKKIVLSIAIRLKSEEFIIGKISNPAFVNGIKSNQTFELIKAYRDKFPADYSSADLFERVNLMTPENIHLNSFMYEPIIDISREHLKFLYRDIIALIP